MLGMNLAYMLRKTHEVFGTYASHPVHVPGTTFLQMDMDVPEKIEERILALAPHAVIHCAALTNVDACEQAPEAAMRINAQGAGLVARTCKAVNARLVHISTDAVFPGTAGGYTEQDRTGPVNAYGRSKLEGEREVAEHHPEALILRTNMFGLGPSPGRGLAGWMLQNAQRGIPFTGFVDSFFAPLSVNTLGTFIQQCLALNIQGTFHAASDKPLSKYDFARLLLRQWQFDASLVRQGRVADAAFTAPRPSNASLNGERLNALLHLARPVQVQEDIRRLHELSVQDWGGKLWSASSQHRGEHQ